MNPDMPDLILSVSDFVGVLNQTLEFAYPNVVIVGELANFRVNKNRWVYFDLKDEFASVKFFGTIYQLPGPLEDGLMLQVRGQPRLHQLYGFSVNVQTIQPVGEGSLRKAAALLEAKLRAEGLFEPARKRPVPYPPATIGLVASSESAAYADFMKIINARWGGIEVQLADVLVQGEQAPAQIVRAIEYFNAHAQPPEVLVLTRGGGSAEDLAAFSTEQVTRAVAASRIPTVVAIGHEVDLSLAELAADQRASTPSNAAELLVPDKTHEKQALINTKASLQQALSGHVALAAQHLKTYKQQLGEQLARLLLQEQNNLSVKKQLLQALNPERILDQGYALVKQGEHYLGPKAQLKVGQAIQIILRNQEVGATIQSVTKRSK
jgi:exodeoxyribonuclease VII large subunit